jgi:hypothetical protein
VPHGPQSEKESQITGYPIEFASDCPQVLEITRHDRSELLVNVNIMFLTVYNHHPSIFAAADEEKRQLEC